MKHKNQIKKAFNLNDDKLDERSLNFYRKIIAKYKSDFIRFLKDFLHNYLNSEANTVNNSRTVYNGKIEKIDAILKFNETVEDETAKLTPAEVSKLLETKASHRKQLLKIAHLQPDDKFKSIHVVYTEVNRILRHCFGVSDIIAFWNDNKEVMQKNGLYFKMNHLSDKPIRDLYSIQDKANFEATL